MGYMLPTEGYNNLVSNTYKFLGLNRSHYTYKGEFEDMKNMSADEYPCIYPRKSRVEIDTSESSVTVDEILAVAPPNGNATSKIKGVTGIVKSGGKTMFVYNGFNCSSGFDLDMYDEFEILQYSSGYVINCKNVSDNLFQLFSYNAADGTFQTGNTVMDDLVVTVGKDTDGYFIRLLKYGYTTISKYSVTTNSGRVIKCSDFFDKYTSNGYLFSSSNPFEKNFAVGDELSISGFPKSSESVGQIFTYSQSDDEVKPQLGQDYSDNNTVSIDDYMSKSEVSINSITKAVVKSFKSIRVGITSATSYIHYIYFDLYNKNGDSSFFSSMDGSQTLYCCGVKLEKKIPHFTNTAFHHNRLWGTTKFGSQIYGSTSDDIFDFSTIDEQTLIPLYARLTSTLSGDFTGLAEYGTDFLAFKDTSITIIYGNNNEDYATNIINGIGCIDPKSICVTPQGVIFLSYGGWYLFTGAQVPTLISKKLYNSRYASCTACYDGDIYYAAAVDKSGNTELLTYDLRYKLWHCYDDFKLVGGFMFRGEFHIADNEKLYTTEDSNSEGFEWSITSCKTHNNTLDSKVLNEAFIRADVSDNARFTLSTSTDGGNWVSHGEAGKPYMNVYHIPIRIAPCNSFRWKIEGKGRIIFYEIELRTANKGRHYRNVEATVDPDDVVVPNENTTDDLIMY